MTIKEVEARSGMTRANIRYYEQEGLLTPRRTANGYRDYSPDDLETLKRIRLLRSLTVSLEELRALQTGAAQLSDTLEQKLRELAQEKRELSFAQELCRAMREEQAAYPTLDAQKYLDRVPQGAAVPRSLERTVDSVPQVLHPWRRFLARQLDLYAYTVAWSVLLALCFHVNFSLRSGFWKLLDGFVAALLMLFAEPLLLRLFGTTLGKWIFGLHLEDADGRRPGYVQGLSRTWSVIGAGMGYGIPIYSLYRLWKSYKLCSEQEPQPWDDRLPYSIRDTKWYRGVAFVGAGALLVGVLVVSVLMSEVPPNRGSLTVAQFAENYNALSSYYGAEGAWRLNQDGQWETQPGTAVIILPSGSPEAVFRYTVEDGYLTGVHLEMEAEDTDWFLSYPSDETILSALAFVGAQNEVGLFSGIRSGLSKELAGHGFEDFSLNMAGVHITSSVDYSGYGSTGSGQTYLLPLDGAETRFYMLFSMEKRSGEN